MNLQIGDATSPIGEGKKIIMHIVNNKGGWGAGFVLAISKKWKLPEQKYRQWSKSDNFKLGQVQFVGVGGGITIANMLAQDGYYGVAVKYDHLRECLKLVAQYAKEKNSSVHSPKIGSGLAGGNWDIIKKMIDEEIPNTTVYEFKP